MLTLPVTLKEVLTGIRLSLGWAKAAGATSAVTAAAADSTMASFLVVRNMFRISLLQADEVCQLSPAVNYGNWSWLGAGFY
jgi:hypothetical protein